MKNIEDIFYGLQYINLIITTAFIVYSFHCYQAEHRQRAHGIVVSLCVCPRLSVCVASWL